jgi:serine phosphatase RsbU (regulator of sigma subunit)
VPDHDPEGLVREARLLGDILDRAHLTPPHGLVAMLAAEAAAAGLHDLTVYLQDHDQLALMPLEPADPGCRDEAVEGTLPGRVFASVTALEADADGGTRLWLPLLDGSNRLGVLGVTVPRVDEARRRTARHLTALVAELLLSKNQYSDLLFLTRRRRATSLAAEMQWQLLPPLTLETADLAVAGAVEPAYDVGGDCFDYALNGDVLHFAIFDAMGHGLRAATMSAVVMGAYRHARRGGVDLAGKYARLDAAVADQFGDDHFATAQLAHLDGATGELRWVNAGHPRPLLVRGTTVVRALRGPTTLPIGLGGGAPEVISEALEPGDRVLFFTDGVVEQETEDGVELGFSRLADHVERQAAAGIGCAETVRRTAAALLKPEGGLRDDATLLLVEWKGRS